MDAHQIAEQYAVLPAMSPPLPEDEYTASLRADFHQHYVQGRDVWTGEQAMRATPRILLRELQHTAGARILDIGTGHGKDAAILLSGGHRVCGIDLVESPEWATLTARWPERASFVAAELTEVTGSEEYDAILDNGCLHHQHPERYPHYLRRVRELLYPQGLFTASVFHSATGRSDLFVNGGQRLYQEFTHETLTELLSAHGFTPVNLELVPRSGEGLHYLVGTFRRTDSGAPDA